jgi:hypothetical protein
MLIGRIRRITLKGYPLKEQHDDQACQAIEYNRQQQDD